MISRSEPAQSPLAVQVPMLLAGEHEGSVGGTDRDPPGPMAAKDSTEKNRLEKQIGLSGHPLWVQPQARVSFSRRFRTPAATVSRSFPSQVLRSLV